MAKSMTPEHKEALAQGRAQARAVRRYLEALEAQTPKRGRKRTPESVLARIDAVTSELAGELPSPLRRLQLIQERSDLEAELERLQSNTAVDIASLEAEFIANAAGYSAAKGIGYTAWREIGVTPAVLKAAGIPATRRSN